jgi:hypothetical protein
MLVSCSTYALILKMVAISSSATSAEFHWTAELRYELGFYIPEHGILHPLKSYTFFYLHCHYDTKQKGKKRVCIQFGHTRLYLHNQSKTLCQAVRLSQLWWQCYRWSRFCEGLLRLAERFSKLPYSLTRFQHRFSREIIQCYKIHWKTEPWNWTRHSGTGEHEIGTASAKSSAISCCHTC